MQSLPVESGRPVVHVRRSSRQRTRCWIAVDGMITECGLVERTLARLPKRVSTCWCIPFGHSNMYSSSSFVRGCEEGLLTVPSFEINDDPSPVMQRSTNSSSYRNVPQPYSLDRLVFWERDLVEAVPLCRRLNSSPSGILFPTPAKDRKLNYQCWQRVQSSGCHQCSSIIGDGVQPGRIPLTLLPSLNSCSGLACVSTCPPR
jgi:hypothetical protein